MVIDLTVNPSRLMLLSTLFILIHLQGWETAAAVEVRDPVILMCWPMGSSSDTLLIPTVACLETFISLRLPPAGTGTGAVAGGGITIKSVCMRAQLREINLLLYGIVVNTLF